MMLMAYWSFAVQPGTAVTAPGDDEVRHHKGCRTFLLRPRARRPSDSERYPHAEANLPTRYPTHRKQRGGSKFDDTRGNGLKTGGYLHLPKDTHHYEWNTEDTVIQLSGTGPDRDDLP